MMLSILLDTQIVLWWIDDNQKLNDSTIKYVKDADKVFVSDIIFEIKDCAYPRLFIMFCIF